MDYQKGRGAQIKPENKFLRHQLSETHPEGIDDFEKERVTTQLYEDTARKIINVVKSSDIPTPYSMNPYQGCEHGCAYCYARITHEYYGFDSGLDFESKIIIKENAPRLLEKELSHPKWVPGPIMLSGNTDCYQPVEKQLEITRKLLEVLLRFRHPVSVITKNTLILRDLDLLKELAADNLVHVMLSITTLDEKLRTKMEPRTSTAQLRLKAIQTLTSSGIPTGVMHAPIIPGLNDNEIPAVLKAASEHGALTAGMTIVRLNGSIGEIFSDWLKRNYPDRHEKVMGQIADLHGGAVEDHVPGRRMEGSGNFAHSIHNLFEVSKRKYFAGRSFPPYDLTRFRRSGNLSLF
jgi:DNA repair photolyase